MKPRPIAAPLDGEHLAAIYPSSEEAMATTWRRRLNLFTGRSLTAPALAVEQIGRAGRFAVRGQMLSPGVVSGLEIATETVSEPATGAPEPVTRHFINIAAGL